jgi:lysophospholipid acyltransferase (LPLAT)-like uncharacterized protein
MKSFFKRLSKTSGFIRIICWLIANYIRIVHYSSLKTYDIDNVALPYVRGELPAVFAFWHGRLLMMPMLCPPKRKMNVLISTHRDGELISRAMHNFGFRTIRGSSTRGGTGAAIRSVKRLQAGDNVSITPDGPRGPAQHVQEGIITIAQMAKIPIIGVTYSASRHRRMRSWDRFMVALPFGRIHYKISAPLFDPDKEALERVMVSQVRDADSHYA